MAFNLLETVREYITPHLLNQASGHFNELTGHVSQATAAAVPAVLDTFVRHAEKGNAQELLRNATQVSNANALKDLDSLAREPAVTNGWELFTGMAGAQSTHLAANLSDFAGIKTRSAEGLLGMITQLGLGVVGRYAMETELSAQGLTNFLSDQKPTIESALPAELSYSAQHVAAAQSPATESLQSRQEKMRQRIGRNSRLPYYALTLLFVFAIVYIYFVNKPLVHSKTREAPATTTTTLPVQTPPPAPTKRLPAQIKLVNGVVINAYHGGVEDQLIACLHNTGCVAGTNQWFDFDNLNFETNSARLTPASMEQVQNIAAILKAYPNAKIKIGGYTDKTGNAAANRQLSKQRADAVLNAIKNAGANPAQLVGAEGYGSQFAKVPATAPDEERRKDRRIAVSLREK